MGDGVFDLTIDSSSLPTLNVVSFRGREHLSKAYTFNIVVEARDAGSSAVIHELAGARAHFKMGGGEEGRTIHGMIRAVEAEGTSGGTLGGHRYRVELVPRFWFLSRRKNTRIFQNLTVAQIVSTLLNEQFVEHKWLTASTYQPRIYCVQYEESDAAFIKRLLAEEGMFFHFEHPPEGSEVIVFCDSPDLVAPLAPSPNFHFNDSSGMEDSPADLRRFQVVRRVSSGSVFLREFDFLRPSANLTSTSTEGPEERNVNGVPSLGFDESRMEVYTHHSEYFGFGASPQAASTQLAQHRRRAWIALAEGRSMAIYPGHTIDLTGAALAEHNGLYSVVSVEHAGTVPERRTSGMEPVYTNRLELVPARFAYRPKFPRRKVVQVMETATVVGPERHEIYTDEHGRIKVQFHWDREGRRNEHSSCWMRVMQPWSGAGWGFQFIPRVGMEVLVIFVGGDVDKPMVLGSVPNAEHPMPFVLPQNKTRSGIRAETTRGGQGYNEISFEDKRHHEEIHLRAQRNLNELVLADHTTNVNGSQTTRVGAQQTDIVGGHRFEIVSQNRITEVAGSDSVSVQQMQTVSVHQSQAIHVGGSQSIDIDRDTSLQAKHRITTVTENDRLSIGGDQVTGVHGRVQHTVRRSIDLKTGGNTHAQFGADLFVGVHKKLNLRVEQELTITCGDSSIRMTPTSVEIRGKRVHVCGDDETHVCGNSASFMLDGDLFGRGDSVNFSSTGANITLDSNATVKASQIAMKSGSGESKSTSSNSNSSTKPPRKLSFSVHDDDTSVSEGKDLVIRNSGGEEQTRIPASAAKSNSGNLFVFELDPEEYTSAIEVTWETPENTVHIAGPVEPARLRNALLSGEIDLAESLAKKRARRSPYHGYVKETFPPVPTPQAEDPIENMGSGREPSIGHTWLAPQPFLHHPNSEQPLSEEGTDR
ncbi:MAG: type VI secretion system tip protein VgrG [Polyangiaceae bacterium]|nr:type VI secretion system tip protein VgrG [Polyangiaceae bacterium]